MGEAGHDPYPFITKAKNSRDGTKKTSGSCQRPGNSTDNDEDTQTDHALDVFQLAMPFNEDGYTQKLIDWVIKLRLSYREVTDEVAIDILTYDKPSLARLLPMYHSTLTLWVKDLMAARLPFIVDLVQSGLSNINLSIDAWRAHNRRGYAAVCAHFVDGNDPSNTSTRLPTTVPRPRRRRSRSASKASDSTIRYRR